MNNFQQRCLPFSAVFDQKIWKIKSQKNPPNIMALPNPFQNTFNAPPWPSQAQQTKFRCKWTPRSDFLWCFMHRPEKKSPWAAQLRPAFAGSVAMDHARVNRLIILFYQASPGWWPTVAPRCCALALGDRGWKNLLFSINQNNHETWNSCEIIWNQQSVPYEWKNFPEGVVALMLVSSGLLRAVVTSRSTTVPVQ